MRGPGATIRWWCSLANTTEPLFLVNRPGSRPSHEGAAQCFDQAIELCKQAGFRQILLRGDSDFSQTEYLDGWDAAGNVRFIFGIDAMANLKRLANDLPETGLAGTAAAGKVSGGDRTAAAAGEHQGAGG